ncbi:MAG: SsrA-binding protein SmpB [Bacilli bacterium]
MEILNRKAHFNYFIIEEYECGIELFGTEIKSIRKGSADLKDSYGRIKDNEIYLVNTYIAKYTEGNRFNHEERRSRKLLLHKSEILKIKKSVEINKYTLIPLKMYIVRGKAKILLGVCKGKKLFDKRRTEKERDLKREERENY